MAKGIKLVTDGTDNHLLLLKTDSVNLSGKEAEHALEVAGITCNKNMVPKDCFIDFREFISDPDPYRALYSYVSGISEARFKQYQQAGHDFLNSSRFAPFISQAFAEYILRPIEAWF